MIGVVVGCSQAGVFDPLEDVDRLGRESSQGVARRTGAKGVQRAADLVDLAEEIVWVRQGCSHIHDALIEGTP